MKKVNFNSLQNFEVPEGWIENALNASPKRKKPLLLRPYLLGTAASLVILSAVVLTLSFHTGDTSPLSPRPDVPVMTTAPMDVTDETVWITPTAAVEITNPAGEVIGTEFVTLPPVAQQLSESQTNSPSVQATAANSTENTAPNSTGSTNGTTATGETQPTAAHTTTLPRPTQQPTEKLTVPIEAPTEALTEPPEPWEPWHTDPPIEEPTDHGVGDPELPPATYPQQPYWGHDIEIQIYASNPLFNNSAVYLHIVNAETGEEVYPVRSEQERLHFYYADNQVKKAVFPTREIIRKFTWYTLYYYDRQGNVERHGLEIVRDPSAVYLKLE